MFMYIYFHLQKYTNVASIMYKEWQFFCSTFPMYLRYNWEFLILNFTIFFHDIDEFPCGCHNVYSSDVFSVSLDAGWFSQYSKALCRFFSLFILTKSRKWFRILVCDVLYKKIYPLYKDFYLKIRHPIMNIYHSELVSILRLFIVHQLGRETFIYMVCMYCEYSSLNYILYM